ncbi:chemotaxis protein CheV [Marinomonas balearica]|uniref:Two-component system chemotaxis response regulator CheV n=1 Tax=Marinomonas balearica TaxID=491947 RepID=A0A4R6MD63_9GAMM|nr:chemotaxis protein CheV [Marinomonas balearica]TDO98209.1 two-component system chemotaxis response regulator CheV [Marinomonas balearica]
MAGVLDSVNQRTQLVGENRLELLLFRLNGKQIYGINVFKVKEVLQCPKLTTMPHSSSVVRGVAHIRGGTIPILDLGLATGASPIENIDQCFVIITEYNRRIQGFLVRGVERIVNMNWSDIQPPPKGLSNDNYLTAVCQVEKEMVEIIDVEQILSEVAPTRQHISEGIVTGEVQENAKQHHILIVDDSSVARKQIKRCMEDVGFATTVLCDGLEAITYLKNLVDEGVDITSQFSMVISDIEMPEMDGYTLTTEVRNDSRLQDLFILLHTSLSGVFNEAMVKKVGADGFLAKFQPDELARIAIETVEAKESLEA